MIFVTVGAQMPFDRLIAAVDSWAQARGRTDVFAQIGRTSRRPGHLAFAESLAPEEFRERVARARAIVSHAGMGTLLTALELSKPILVMPRHASLRETRNDHQVATALQFRDRSGVLVAMDENELPSQLDRLETLHAAAPISRYASDELIRTVRNFIHARAVQEE